jgi:pimeloyl-ACP methyl ester carboxylesterase
MARRMPLVTLVLLLPCSALAQPLEAPKPAVPPAAPVRFDHRVAVVKSVIEEGLQPSEAGAQPVSFRSADGVTVFGDLYAAAGPVASGGARGTLLLFHAANSNRGEYTAIAPIFVKEGYDALAIDQRAGGRLWGRANETAKGLAQSGRAEPQRLASSLADLEAALDFVAKRPARPIVAVGSGYSAALVFLLAARHPDTVGAIMAFSPANDLGGAVGEAVARVKCPVFITSAAEHFDIDEARRYFDAVPASDKHQLTPQHGITGASTLRADLNPFGAAESWQAVGRFLGGLDALARPAVAGTAPLDRKTGRPRQTARGPSEAKRFAGDASASAQAAPQ